MPVGTYRNNLQRAINAAIAQGIQPVIVTIPPPCCNRAALRPFTDSFTREQERLAFFNLVPIADVARAWKTTCVSQTACRLLNVPEGLHPNTLGYDVMAQTILATLYGVDIFAPGGAEELAGALGIGPEEIDVRPDSSAPGQPTTASSEEE